MIYGYLYLSILIGSIAAINSAYSQSPARQHYDLGVKYGYEGSFDSAKVAFQKSLKIDSTFVPARLNLMITEDVLSGKLDKKAAIYYFSAIDFGNKDDFDNKIESLNKAIEISPDFALAYNDRGIAFAKQNHYDQAITDYDNAIKFFPDFSEAYMNKALACDKLNRPKKALEAYQGFIKYAGDRNDRYTFYANNRIKELKNSIMLEK